MKKETGHYKFSKHGFGGAYKGESFQVTKMKTDKVEYKRLAKILGHNPEYFYESGDYGNYTFVDKKQFKDILKNSEVLYDEKKRKYIRNNSF